MSGLVGDQDHRVAGLVQLVEELHDLRRGGRVEVAGGLVGEQDRGLVDQGAGDRHALALAARELVGLVVHAVARAPPSPARAARPLAPLAARHAGVDQRQLDVVQRVGAGQQVEGLEDEADLLVADAPPARWSSSSWTADAVEAVGARGRRVEAADQVHQRRLAAARRAHDRHVLAALDRRGRRRSGRAPSRRPCRRPCGCPAARSAPSVLLVLVVRRFSVLRPRSLPSVGGLADLDRVAVLQVAQRCGRAR